MADTDTAVETLPASAKLLPTGRPWAGSKGATAGADGSDMIGPAVDPALIAESAAGWGNGVATANAKAGGEVLAVAAASAEAEFEWVISCPTVMLGPSCGCRGVRQ